jgi:hypothetical protein
MITKIIDKHAAATIPVTPLVVVVVADWVRIDRGQTDALQELVDLLQLLLQATRALSLPFAIGRHAETKAHRAPVGQFEVPRLGHFLKTPRDS